MEKAFPVLPMESMDEDQRAIATQLLKASNGYTGGPIPMLVRSPEMSARLRPLISYFALHTTIPKRLKELAILIQASYWEQDYEWWAHHELALDAGLSPATTSALKAGKRPENLAPDEQAIYDFCRQMLIDHKVSDATLAAVRDHFDDRQIVDLIGVSGVYALLAMMLNVAGEKAPIDAPKPNPGVE